jgi:uncharacterized protein (TIGR00369 family)
MSGVEPAAEAERAAAESVDNDVRSRTFTWEDPAASAAEGMKMAGLDYMQAIVSGEAPRPPIAALLDFRVAEAAPGRAVFEMEPAEWMFNPIGSVHGGIAATLLDSCMGCAVHTTLPAGVGYTTGDLQVRYIRAMTGTTGLVVAEGRVVHRGRRTATAEGRLFVRDSGDLIAHGTTGCLILA